MVPMGGLDALQDRAGISDCLRSSVFGHAFYLFEMHHRQYRQGARLARRVLFHVAMGVAVEVDDDHCRGTRHGLQTWTV